MSQLCSLVELINEKGQLVVSSSGKEKNLLRTSSRANKFFSGELMTWTFGQQKLLAAQDY